MPKTVACLLVDSPRVFAWLGHLPIMTWTATNLAEVRGVDRIVCVATADTADRARKLLDPEVEVVRLPKELVGAKPGEFDRWLTAATGPACDADVVVAVRPTSPFLPAAKIEACVAAVRRGRCSVAQPAQAVNVVVATRKTPAPAAVESVRVFAVKVPAEPKLHTVRVSMIEALDVTDPDQFVMADALVTANKV